MYIYINDTQYTRAISHTTPINTKEQWVIELLSISHVTHVTWRITQPPLQCRIHIHMCACITHIHTHTQQSKALYNAYECLLFHIWDTQHNREVVGRKLRTLSFFFWNWALLLKGSCAKETGQCRERICRVATISRLLKIIGFFCRI